MKLLSKYSRVNMFATILVLILGSICYYFIIRYVLIRQLDDTLKIEEAEILDYVNMKNRLPEPANYKDQLISFENGDPSVKRNFKSIGLYIPEEHEKRPYRRLEFPVTVNNRLYRVTVSKSQLETEDLLGLIVLITVAVILLLLLIQFVVNRYLMRKMWNPFYDTLDDIKKFNLRNRIPLPRHATDIDEFSNLEMAVNQMTGKIIRDYDMQKQFADNASHEMQTPLAVINSKLDLLIQEQGMDEKQVKQLQAMYDAVGRLSKLNQSLLMLTKIENDQYDSSDTVYLDVLAEEKLHQLEELIEARQLTVSKSLDHVPIQANQYLVDMLMNNLMINAIRHNTPGGVVDISIEPGKMVIRNTGQQLSFDSQTIFDRFKKGNNPEGMGLGLAIVKQICDKYQFDIAYSRENDLHCFTLRF